MEVGTCSGGLVVAPHAGARIETLFAVEGDEAHRSLLMRERELKPYHCPQQQRTFGSLPMRERELKRQDVCNDRTR